MNKTPDFDSLDSALRSLPRQTASPGFTRRVLATVEAPSRSNRFDHLRPLLVLGAAACALMVVLLLPHRQQSEIGDISLAEVERLEETGRDIAEELARLRHELEQPPTLYLGGDERVNLVLDLSQPSSAFVNAALAGPTAVEVQ